MSALVRSEPVLEVMVKPAAAAPGGPEASRAQQQAASPPPKRRRGRAGDRPTPPLEEVQEELLKQVTETAQRAIIEESRAAAEVERLDEAMPAAAIMADQLLQPAE